MSKKRRMSSDNNIESEEERYFLNLESVSQHLYCSICQDVFVEPQRAPCGHSFCKKCIGAWLKTSRTCPEDRKPVDKKQLHHDFILENIIGDQMVACPFRRHGCDFVGQLQLLKSHKKKCSFNPENLPEFMKEDLTKASSQSEETFDFNGEDIDAPVKPSLKMRLFSAGDNKREMLCQMFNKENKPST